METAPKSPYAHSKAEAMELVRQAREHDGLFAASGIFYNHESPLRGSNFVTRKITMALRAYGAMATSAARGAVRDVGMLKRG